MSDIKEVKSEKRSFDAKVSKVLKIMINSLYTNKDIFLRELISNASDACEKLRYLALTDEKILGDDADLKISIIADEENNTLTIRDNGIGMNKDDLIANLGTIANSGTQDFLENFTGDTKNLIGQFGVGFYSSYMVADKVIVKSKKAGEEAAYKWISEGEDDFYIEQIEEDFKRGTEITLFLREDEKDFCNKFTIQHIIHTYSDNVLMPVELITKDETEIVNKGTALWTKDKKNITEEQYLSFYRTTAHMGDTPWMTLHNKNEGTVEFTNLLFIPTSKPFDLFNPDRKGRVKLYVKRIFITEDQIEILPPYLRFVRGIIDSDDLPLNISRETLQNNHILEKIKRSTIKKIITELRKKSENERESYLEFWNNFGAVLKEGLCESFEQRDDILDICLFYSALKNEYVTLQDYVDNMKSDQKDIFYLTGETIEKLKNSPQLEGFVNRNIDVLLLADHVDDFWVNVVSQFKDHDLKSITRTGIDLDEIEKDQKNENNSEETTEAEKVVDYEKLIEFFKKTLSEKVSDVKITRKLASSPACLAVAEGSMDIRMEKFLLEQNQLKSKAAKILEINPNNKIVKKIANDLENSTETSLTTELTEMLFDQACILEGVEIEDVGLFSKRLNKILEYSL